MRRRDRFNQLTPAFLAGFFLAVLGFVVLLMLYSTLERLSAGAT